MIQFQIWTHWWKISQNFLWFLEKAITATMIQNIFNFLRSCAILSEQGAWHLHHLFWLLVHLCLGLGSGLWKLRMDRGVHQWDDFCVMFCSSSSLRKVAHTHMRYQTYGAFEQLVGGVGASFWVALRMVGRCLLAIGWLQIVAAGFQTACSQILDPGPDGVWMDTQTRVWSHWKCFQQLFTCHCSLWDTPGQI